MWPELGSLPPGIVPLILILGGLAFSLPVTAATMLKPPAPRPAASPRVRSVLVTTRPPADPKRRLDVRGLPPLDAALELAYASGVGDPRILYSDAHRKLVRFTLPDGREADEAYLADAKRALEDAFTRALGRAPQVTELSHGSGRCEFLVSY